MNAKIPICYRCQHNKTVRATDSKTPKEMRLLMCQKVEIGSHYVGNEMYDGKGMVMTLNLCFRIPDECPYILEHTV